MSNFDYENQNDSYSRSDDSNDQNHEDKFDNVVRPFPTQPSEKGDSQSQDDVDTQGSTLNRISTKLSFFNQRLASERLFIAKKVILVYLIMGVGVLGILSIYWGSMFKIDTRYKNLKMLVVIEDDKTVGGIEPLMGNSMKSLLEETPVNTWADWITYNSSQFREVAEKNHNNIEQEIERQIHHQLYWASVYVKPNATYNFYRAIVDGDAHYNVSNSSIVSIYESGRDISGMKDILPQLSLLEEQWLATSNVSAEVFERIDKKSEVSNNVNSMKILTSSLQFTRYDLIPVTDTVLLAPSQVGLIYMIIVTFFQISMFAELHHIVGSYNLKPASYVLYRISVSVGAFFLLALYFALVSLAFQVDFTVAFGKSGFLVYWMTAFATMWAVGLMNEIMATLFFMFAPKYIGFWLIFWVVVNISPTFTPNALTAKFFRYGYALPIHNSYEITKVIFLNTYKGQMGRNFGIIFAWIVLETLAFPFVLHQHRKFVAKKAKKQ